MTSTEEVNGDGTKGNDAVNGTSASTTPTFSDGISPVASSRACDHMNVDHAPTVHALCLSTLTNRERRTIGGVKVSNAKLTSISLEKYGLSFVVCDGDACRREVKEVEFVPPMASAKEMRPRLIEEHHRALSPKISWLYSDPLISLIFITVLLLASATHILGRDALADLIDSSAPSLVSGSINLVFGSSRFFADMVAYSWYFTVVAHLAEATYAAHECRSRLKLKPGATWRWHLMICTVGYPVTKKVLELVEVDKEARKKA